MNSLFKLKDLWFHKPNSDFYSDFGQIAIYSKNLLYYTCKFEDSYYTSGNNPESMYVVCGDHYGMLRIYNPRKQPFEPAHMILEMNIGFPILQVDTGVFNEKATIIALTPNKLIIYELKEDSISTGKGSTIDSGITIASVKSLVVIREFTLNQTAYNFVTGNFGRTGQLSIAVQSMNGRISIFKLSGELFSRYLPPNSFLCPGRLAYSPLKDALLTGSSNYEIQCYSYQTLLYSIASEHSTATTGRKLMPDWKITIGEDITDIKLCCLTNHEPLDILVAGGMSLFILNQNTGKIKWSKKFDMRLTCIYPYYPNGSNTAVLMVGCLDKQIIILKDDKVVWCAQTNSVPIQLAVANIDDTPGMIVMLSVDGVVSSNILGTDFANKPVQLVDSKELDYDAMDKEQQEVQQKIEETLNHVKKESVEHLKIKSIVQSCSLQCCTVQTTITNDSLSYITDVTVTISTSSIILISEPVVKVSSLSHSEMLTINSTFKSKENFEDCIPSTLCYSVSVEFSLQSNIIVTEHKGQLPLAMFAQVSPPVKNNEVIVQLDTNRPVVSLTEIFSDMQSAEIEHNIATFVFYRCNFSVTILASKNGGKYRIQSESRNAAWIVLQYFTEHLINLYNRDIVFSTTDPLPIINYLEYVDTHFSKRMLLKSANNELEVLASQYRAIQKRLLMRYKDKDPSSIEALETLLQETNSLIFKASDRHLTASDQLIIASEVLSSATNLLLFITEMKCKHLDPIEVNALYSYLTPNISLEDNAVGWEEVVNSSMRHLLSTSLSKNIKEKLAESPSIQPMENVTMLKKHITVVFNRIECGGKVLSHIPVL